jgi:hypothetical protein
MTQNQKDLLVILNFIYNNQEENGADYHNFPIKLNKENSTIIVVHNLAQITGNFYKLTPDGIKTMFELRIEEINANREISETRFHQQIQIILGIASVATTSYYISDAMTKSYYQISIFLGSSLLIITSIFLYIKLRR